MPSRPPRRADAQRNYDRLLAAAEKLFNAQGVGASLDDIAKAAGVGNATLYRHFPTRHALIEAVFDHKVAALCEAANEPGVGLVEWLHQVVVLIIESRVLAEAVLAGHSGPAGEEPPQIAAWHSALKEAATPLLAAAQDAGEVRRDLNVNEILALTSALVRAGDPKQAGRYFQVLLEGIVPRSASGEE